MPDQTSGDTPITIPVAESPLTDGPIVVVTPAPEASSDDGLAQPIAVQEADVVPIQSTSPTLIAEAPTCEKLLGTVDLRVRINGSQIFETSDCPQPEVSPTPIAVLRLER